MVVDFGWFRVCTRVLHKMKIYRNRCGLFEMVVGASLENVGVACIFSPRMGHEENVKYCCHQLIWRKECFQFQKHKSMGILKATSSEWVRAARWVLCNVPWKIAPTNEFINGGEHNYLYTSMSNDYGRILCVCFIRFFFRCCYCSCNLQTLSVQILESVLWSCSVYMHHTVCSF